jgi:hypothetical protein
VQAVLGLGQVDLAALGGQAAREGHLVVVDVLAEAVLAGHDDGDGTHVPGPKDGPGPAVADDRGRAGHGLLEGVELEVGPPLGRPRRWRGRGAGLHQAAQLAGMAVQPGAGPADQPVEGVVVGPDADQQQRRLIGGHRRLPMTLPLG